LTYPFSAFLRPLILSPRRLMLAALVAGVLAPSAAAAVQSAELYSTQKYFYGRFEARVRHAPGEGVVSSFFLWKDRPNNSGPWNELDFEKINSDCRLQTNIWTGTGTQSTMINTPSFNICNDYHTYGFEWTPDYIAWFIDGAQIRKVTGASVTEYTQNATAGMAIHFNIWQGDSSFGGNLSTSTLPVYEYISWAQYSSYANGAFTLQWREEFTGTGQPANWLYGDWLAPLNHSTHNMANVKIANGIAVLAMTNDGATGYTGTPPADPGAGGTSGTGGTGGSTGRGGAGGSGGTGGSTATGGRGGGTGGSASPGTGGSSSPGTGGSSSPGTGGNGAGGTTAGAAGSGAGGASAGAAGSGAAGSGGPGNAGAGGQDTSGTGGQNTTGAGGQNTTGTGGQNTTGAGGAAAGGSSGAAGSTGQTGGGGCSCEVASCRGGGAAAALLLVAAIAGRRRRRSVEPRR